MSTITEPTAGGTVNGTSGNDTFIVSAANANFNGDGGVERVESAPTIRTVKQLSPV